MSARPGELGAEVEGAGNGIFRCRDRRPKSTRESVIVRQRPPTLKTGGKIPVETASFRLITFLEVREDWVVETIWTKLDAPHADIEPVSDASSQERNFLLQRQGAVIGLICLVRAGAETALGRENWRTCL